MSFYTLSAHAVLTLIVALGLSNAGLASPEFPRSDASNAVAWAEANAREVIRGDYHLAKEFLGHLLVLNGSHVEFYDISEPNQPRKVSSYTGIFTHGADRIAVDADRRLNYICRRDGTKMTLAVMSMADMRRPTLVGQIDDVDCDSAGSFALRGNVLIAVAHGNRIVKAFDVSNPSRPVFLARRAIVDDLAFGTFHDGAVVTDDRTLVVFSMRDGEAYAHSVDLSHPERIVARPPVKVAAFPSRVDLGNGHGTFLSGRTTYLLLDTYLLTVEIDASGGVHQTALTQVPASARDDHSGSVDFMKDGDRLFIASAMNGLWIFDVASPGDPRFLRIQRDFGRFRFSRMTRIGELVVACGFMSHGLAVFRLADEAFVPVARLFGWLGRSMRRLYESGPFLVGVASHGGMFVADTTDFSKPVAEAAVDFGSGLKKLVDAARFSNFLVTAEVLGEKDRGTVDLVVYDLRLLPRFVEVGRATLGLRAQFAHVTLFAEGGRVWVGSKQQPVKAYSLSPEGSLETVLGIDHVGVRAIASQGSLLVLGDSQGLTFYLNGVAVSNFACGRVADLKFIGDRLTISAERFGLLIYDISDPLRIRLIDYYADESRFDIRVAHHPSYQRGIWPPDDDESRSYMSAGAPSLFGNGRQSYVVNQHLIAKIDLSDVNYPRYLNQFYTRYSPINNALIRPGSSILLLSDAFYVIDDFDELIEGAR